MAKEYSISKTVGRCSVCMQELQPGEQFVATVREAQDELQREDFCAACWQAGPKDDAPGLLGVWRPRISQPNEKKKLFVDDDLLMAFFERLDGAEEPAKVSFRFVLALVLMRKKLLVYDNEAKAADGSDVWITHFKGDDRKHNVIDPHMDEDKIAGVSRQLGEILEGEL